MKVNLSNIHTGSDANITIRCPHCGHNGTFEKLPTADINATVEIHFDYILGIRRCPNNRCSGHIFFILHIPTHTITSYPPITIAFETDNIPQNVLQPFEEAIICHSNKCYIASAIMLRKTLEEICIEKGAQGNNLLQKIKDLSSKISIPIELAQGMDDLRLLGNDAAHIESQTFKNIGQEEIEVSIDFTKEILKAVYQYESLLQKLRDLKIKNNN